MSADTVLYDAPGPRARRRHRALGLAALAVIGALAAVVVSRLAHQGQFAAELWSPLLDPSDESFRPVWRLLGLGLLATLTAAALAIAASLVLGSLLGAARLMLGRSGRIPVVGVIELLRGLPVVITIYFVSRVLPEVGVDLSPLPGGQGLWFLVIGLTLYNSVIIAEILRAGVAALPRGQREAGLAMGLTPGATLRLVLLPQAVRLMLPALISQLVVILKDTSLAAVLGLYTELLRQGNLIALNLKNPIQVLALVGLIFIVLNYCLSVLARSLQSRFGRTRTTATTPDVDRVAVPA